MHHDQKCDDETWRPIRDPAPTFPVFMRVGRENLRPRWLGALQTVGDPAGVTTEVRPGSHIGMPSRIPEFAPQRLTNFNGESGDGSSIKTPHIGVPIMPPPLVAQTLQQSRTNQVGEEDTRRGGRPPELPFTLLLARAGCNVRKGKT
jgi:hypothetical protein